MTELQPNERPSHFSEIGLIDSRDQPRDWLSIFGAIKCSLLIGCSLPNKTHVAPPSCEKQGGERH